MQPQVYKAQAERFATLTPHAPSLWVVTALQDSAAFSDPKLQVCSAVTRMLIVHFTLG